MNKDFTIHRYWTSPALDRRHERARFFQEEGHRGGVAEAGGYRQHAPADPRRTRQGRTGSQRDAVTGPSDPAAGLVAGRPAPGGDAARGLVVPGQDPTKPITTRQLSRVVEEAAQAAGITKNVSPHTLRHSFARHLPGCAAGAAMRRITAPMLPSTACHRAPVGSRRPAAVKRGRSGAPCYSLKRARPCGGLRMRRAIHQMCTVAAAARRRKRTAAYIAIVLYRNCLMRPGSLALRKASRGIHGFGRTIQVKGLTIL